VGHSNDRNRSLAFEELADILDDRYEFHILQKELREGDREGVAATVGLRFHGEDLHTFVDTAGLIGEMDLVISVDTSVAHLAGSLGCPLWILLPYSPDFRWLLDRDDTPWYETARLYRQKQIGDWAGVVARVKEDLNAWVPTKTPP
jgi:ADP-heptose:LPS heptosyltransferase